MEAIHAMLQTAIAKLQRNTNIVYWSTMLRCKVASDMVAHRPEFVLSRDRNF